MGAATEYCPADNTAWRSTCTGHRRSGDRAHTRRPRSRAVAEQAPCNAGKRGDARCAGCKSHRDTPGNPDAPACVKPTMRATTLRPTDGFPADRATGVIAVTSPSVPEATPAAPLIKAPGLVTPNRFHPNGALWRVFRIDAPIPQPRAARPTGRRRSRVHPPPHHAHSPCGGARPATLDAHLAGCCLQAVSLESR